MSLVQAITVAFDWLDHEQANRCHEAQEEPETHDALAEAGLAFEFPQEETLQ